MGFFAHGGTGDWLWSKTNESGKGFGNDGESNVTEVGCSVEDDLENENCFGRMSFFGYKQKDA